MDVESKETKPSYIKRISVAAVGLIFASTFCVWGGLIWMYRYRHPPMNKDTDPLLLPMGEIAFTTDIQRALGGVTEITYGDGLSRNGGEYNPQYDDFTNQSDIADTYRAAARVNPLTISGEASLIIIDEAPICTKNDKKCRDVLWRRLRKVEHLMRDEIESRTSLFGQDVINDETLRGFFVESGMKDKDIDVIMSKPRWRGYMLASAINYGSGGRNPWIRKYGWDNIDRFSEYSHGVVDASIYLKGPKGSATINAVATKHGTSSKWTNHISKITVHLNNRSMTYDFLTESWER